jgi:hypothetical protein
LIDNDPVADEPSAKVIMLDRPATPGEGVSAKDEAGTAAAISGALERRGSKASQTGSSGSPSTGESTTLPKEPAPLPAHQPRRFPAP